jgi:hypothetical protein
MNIKKGPLKLSQKGSLCASHGGGAMVLPADMLLAIY